MLGRCHDDQHWKTWGSMHDESEEVKTEDSPVIMVTEVTLHFTRVDASVANHSEVTDTPYMRSSRYGMQQPLVVLHRWKDTQWRWQKGRGCYCASCPCPGTYSLCISLPQRTSGPHARMRGSASSRTCRHRTRLASTNVRYKHASVKVRSAAAAAWPLHTARWFRRRGRHLPEHHPQRRRHHLHHHLWVTQPNVKSSALSSSPGGRRRRPYSTQVRRRRRRFQIGMNFGPEKEGVSWAWCFGPFLRRQSFVQLESVGWGPPRCSRSANYCKFCNCDSLDRVWPLTWLECEAVPKMMGLPLSLVWLELESITSTNHLKKKPLPRVVL